MKLHSIKSLRQQARLRLRQDPQAGRLVLLHTAVALAINLVVTAANYYLSLKIDASGGLSGMKTRSILETIQFLLPLISAIVLPFWGYGLLRAGMAFARREDGDIHTLCAGFHRFGPLLRMGLLQLGILMGALTVCTYLVSFMLISTPLGAPIMEILTPMLEDANALTDPYAMLDDATMEALTNAMIPMVSIALVVFAPIAVFFMYKLRLANYFLLDDEPCGVLRAFGRSFRGTRGNFWAFVRLDLSFWWYFLLQGLTTVVANGDLLLQEVGIVLPVSEGAAFFGFYLVSLVMQLILYRFAAGYLHTTRALAYDTVRTPASN